MHCINAIQVTQEKWIMNCKKHTYDISRHHTKNINEEREKND